MKRQSRILASIGLPLFLASGSFAQRVNTNGTAATLSSVNAAAESSVRNADDFVPMTRSERTAHYVHAVFGRKRSCCRRLTLGSASFATPLTNGTKARKVLEGDMATPTHSASSGKPSRT